MRTTAAPLVIALVAGLAAPAAAAGARLSKDDHALLATAAARHQPTVTLLLAADPGANAAVAGSVSALGGSAVSRDDVVDYLRAVVPLGKAEQAAALGGVAAAAVDRVVPHVDPSPPSDARPLGDPPGSTTPPVNPLVPVGDIGAPQFVAAHPTWDGRGTTLGIVDDGVDLLSPELRTARLADGTLADKVVDFRTSSSPDGDRSWVDMSAHVTASAANRFTFGGDTYTAPARGSYSFGVLDERAFGFPMFDGDVNRDGNPPGSSGLFAVLWDKRANSVWVDTDQDRSFADQAAMTDYRVRHDTGVFGVDDPGTPVRETVAFAVQTDPPHDLVDVNVEESEGHGTSVASVGVGKGFGGGAANGAAPGARLAVVRTDFFVGSILDGALYLAEKDKVDVISISLGSTAGATVNPYSVVLGRIVDRLGIPVFAAAGNDGTSANAVARPSTTLGVVSVASSATRATTHELFGYDTGLPEGILWDSSRGPSTDGALKPDLAAPGMSWVALPAWLEGATPGYEPAIGTSFASPAAAGGALLLLSAARQSHVEATADRLRYAILRSARRLAGPDDNAQGRGVVAVGDAWNLLRVESKPVEIQVSAPVVDAWSLGGLVAGDGPGLYEREGWTAGQTGQRMVTLTRLSGPASAITYRLSLTGDDGTFSVPATVKLAKGSPASMSVGIAPAADGLHTAILNVNDPATAGVDAQVGLTVIAAQTYHDANRFTIGNTGSVANDGDAHFFFRVPPEAFSWDSDLSSPSPDGELSWTVATPFRPLFRIGFPFQPFGASLHATTGCWVPSTSPSCVPDVAHVWEFAVTTAFQSAATTPFSLTTRVRGPAAVTPSPVVIDPGAVGATADRTLNFSAGAIGVDGPAHGSSLGPLQAEHRSAAPGDFHVEDFDVPPGTSRLTVEIEHASDPDADLDLYLLHCNDPDCNFAYVDQSTTPSATEWIDVDDPDPGVWTLAVDAFDVPSGSTSFDLNRVAAAPAFGSIVVDDAAAYHPAHDTWAATVHVTPGQAGGPYTGYVRLPGGWTRVEVRNVH